MRERLAALGQAIRIPDVRKRIVFLFAMLGVYVACAHVPLPGIDKQQLERLFSSAGGLGDLLDAFAGGSLKRFSVLALGIMPYISASIILQLLTMAIPALEELQKEGEYGRKKINAWTKYLTMGVALIQALGMTAFFRRGSAFIGDPFLMVYVVVMMVAGTAFLMWLADLITERGIGQGVSLIIFAGIITRMPQDLANTFKLWQGGEIGVANVAFLAAILVATVYGIVKVQQAQRKIPVQYARRVRGHRMYGGATTYLPLRVNQAGVMPIIFAISVAMFPGQIAQFISSPAATTKLAGFMHVSDEAVSKAMFSLVQFTNPGSNYFASFLYFLLVIVFTYFYTAVTFNPEQIAENLQKNGGAIPGIRPGASTRDYLDRILYRITLAGALFLGVIAVMQYYVGDITGVTSFTLVGGTSLLIVVGVALDTMQQIEAQLLMRHYKGFLA
ncbi:MAG TPA: preprotein translocase subunit SecY [Armatimonadota bacterium]|nr:preprotein translocase subunit SecY [Armatimonadota bacterium]